MLTQLRLNKHPMWASLMVVLAAFTVVMAAGCGDDSDDMGNGNGDGSENDNGNGDGGGAVGDIASLVIQGDGQDALPEEYFVGFPLILVAVPYDSDGAQITSGEDVIDFLDGVEWESSNPAVVEIAGQLSPGFLSASLKAPGTATVTATSMGLSDSIEITVKALF